MVEDHNESSPGAYFGTPVNLMILEKDYNCRWIPYDNPLCCTNNDAGELTTRDVDRNELVFPYYSQRLHLLQNAFARPDWKKRHLQQHLSPVIIKRINGYLGNVTFPSPTLKLKKGDIAVGVNFTETQFGTDICAETEIFARRIDDSIFNNNKKISKDKILSSLIEEDIVLTNEWQNKNLGDDDGDV